MAQHQGGLGQRRSQRDKEKAAELRRRGVVRTTGRCAVCYAIVAVDSVKSRYNHRCKA